jgi:hypothetical protein
MLTIPAPNLFQKHRAMTHNPKRAIKVEYERLKYLSALKIADLMRIYDYVFVTNGSQPFARLCPREQISDGVWDDTYEHRPEDLRDLTGDTISKRLTTLGTNWKIIALTFGDKREEKYGLKAIEYAEAQHLASAKFQSITSRVSTELSDFVPIYISQLQRAQDMQAAFRRAFAQGNPVRLCAKLAGPNNVKQLATVMQHKASEANVTHLPRLSPCRVTSAFIQALGRPSYFVHPSVPDKVYIVTPLPPEGADIQAARDEATRKALSLG